MRKRILLTVALLFIAACASVPSDARMRGGAAVAVVNPCPQSGDDNGCSTSPGGSYQVANFFTGYTGTTYPIRPDYNVPCVDYKCGMPETADPVFSVTVSGLTITGSCGTATMVDPAVAATGTGCGEIDPACVYSVGTTGSVAAPIILCSSTANNIILKGLNLGPVGGHLGTYVQVAATVTGKFALAFNHMEADESTYIRNSFGSTASTFTGDIIIFANNMLGNWEDDWSAEGAGTATRSGTTLTISGCSSCGFYPGQILNGTGFSNTWLSEQLTGTPGGDGTYSTTTSGTVASTAVTAFFQMGGGMGCNTTGNVVLQYNYIYQVNGRVGTCSQRQPSGTGTVIPLLANKFNYVEGGIYAGGAHYEMMEYVIQDMNRDLTYDLIQNEGNVQYYTPGIAGGTTTATFYISTGAINGTITPGAEIVRTAVNTINNVVIDDGPAGAVHTSLDAIEGQRNAVPQTIGTYTATGNYVKKSDGYYSFAANAPYGTSFWTGSQAAGTLTVSVFSGGVPLDVGHIIWESGVVITAQLTGTPGGAGTYSYSGTCSISCGSGTRRSALPGISTVAASDNWDIDAGTALTLPVYLTSGTISSSFTYPGMR